MPSTFAVSVMRHRTPGSLFTEGWKRRAEDAALSRRSFLLESDDDFLLFVSFPCFCVWPNVHVFTVNVELWHLNIRHGKCFSMVERLMSDDEWIFTCLYLSYFHFSTSSCLWGHCRATMWVFLSSPLCNTHGLNHHFISVWCFMSVPPPVSVCVCVFLDLLHIEFKKKKKVLVLLPKRGHFCNFKALLARPHIFKGLLEG